MHANLESILAHWRRVPAGVIPHTAINFLAAPATCPALFVFRASKWVRSINAMPKPQGDPLLTSCHT